jgi:hypothetical protein
VTTFHFIATTNDGLVDVAGPRVTWRGGQPFNVFAGNGQWWIDGVPARCRPDGETSATCDTTGNRSAVPYHSDSNIDDEVTVLRLQKVFGANEENLTCAARAVGTYDCRPARSGQGILWAWYLGDGNYRHDNSRAIQLALQPDGSLMLGGTTNRASVVVPAITGEHPVNYLEIAGGASGSPQAGPVLGAHRCGACAEADVPLALQAQGAGTIMALSPVQLPGYTVAGLPACNPPSKGAMAHATDLVVVAYAARPQGGGHADAPVYCDGSAWTIH